MKKSADISERELAALCAKGERPAMRELYNRYAAKLAALCSRYSDGPVEGMDLMHDTMVKVFKTIGKYNYTGEGSLYAWLRKVAINMAIDRIRRERRLDISSLDDDPVEIEEDGAGDITTIPNSALRKMISSLPEAKRLIFNMFCIEGFSHKEIAEMLNILPGASSSTLAKAKKSLARMINEYLEQEK